MWRVVIFLHAQERLQSKTVYLQDLCQGSVICLWRLNVTNILFWGIPNEVLIGSCSVLLYLEYCSFDLISTIWGLGQLVDTRHPDNGGQALRQPLLMGQCPTYGAQARITGQVDSVTISMLKKWNFLFPHVF